MKVGGYDYLFQLGEQSNNKNPNGSPIVNPPIDSHLKISSIISFSSYWDNSIWVDENGQAFAVGSNCYGQISSLIPKKTLLKETKIIIRNKNGDICKFISAVCGENYSLYQLTDDNPENQSQIVYTYRYKTPLFLNISGRIPKLLYGGKETAAIIDTEGAILAIPKSILSSPKQQIKPTFLPDNDRALKISFCDEFLLALGSSGRVFECSLILPGCGKFKEVKELQGQKFIDLAGTFSHCFAVCRDGQVFGRGKNDCGQLGLKSSTKFVSKFTLIDSLKKYKIVSASAGCSHSLFTTNKGQILACGKNYYGELMLKSGPSRLHVYSPTETLLSGQNPFCIAGCCTSFVFLSSQIPPNSPNRTITDFLNQSNTKNQDDEEQTLTEIFPDESLQADYEVIESKNDKKSILDIMQPSGSVNKASSEMQANDDEKFKEQNSLENNINNENESKSPNNNKNESALRSQNNSKISSYSTTQNNVNALKSPNSNKTSNSSSARNNESTLKSPGNSKNASNSTTRNNLSPFRSPNKSSIATPNHSKNESEFKNSSKIVIQSTNKQNESDLPENQNNNKNGSKTRNQYNGGKSSSRISQNNKNESKLSNNSKSTIKSNNKTIQNHFKNNRINSSELKTAKVRKNRSIKSSHFHSRIGLESLSNKNNTMNYNNKNSNESKTQNNLESKKVSIIEFNDQNNNEAGNNYEIELKHSIVNESSSMQNNEYINGINDSNNFEKKNSSSNIEEDVNNIDSSNAEYAQININDENVAQNSIDDEIVKSNNNEEEEENGNADEEAPSNNEEEAQIDIEEEEQSNNADEEAQIDIEEEEQNKNEEEVQNSNDGEDVQNNSEEEEAQNSNNDFNDIQNDDSANHNESMQTLNCADENKDNEVNQKVDGEANCNDDIPKPDFSADDERDAENKKLREELEIANQKIHLLQQTERQNAILKLELALAKRKIAILQSEQENSFLNEKNNHEKE